MMETKSLIEKLMAYKFEYRNKELKDIFTPENPILVIGPAEGDERLRAIAYGGDIGYISPNDDEKDDESTLAKDKNYLNYLQDGFINGRCEVSELPRGFKVGMNYIDDLEETLKHKGIEAKRKMVKKDYLDSMIYASYTRWLKRINHGDKDGFKRPVCGSEKSRQCCIAKKNMESCRPGDGNMLIVDVEHIVRFRDGDKGARIDFVAFNGDSYGLIEFKYLGGSMNGKKANVGSHFEDFRKILLEKDDKFRIDLIREINRRFETLLDYGVIHNSWRALFKEFKEKVEREGFLKNMLWCGFYFLGNSRSIENMDLSKSNYVTRIEIKVKNTMEKYKSDKGRIDVRYQYNADVYDANSEVIVMDKSIWDI